MKLDFRHLPDGYVVQPHDVIAELDRIEHQFKPLEIVARAVAIFDDALQAAAT